MTTSLIYIITLIFLFVICLFFFSPYQLFFLNAIAGFAPTGLSIILSHIILFPSILIHYVGQYVAHSLLIRAIRQKNVCKFVIKGVQGV